jgi:hypothetical protein
MNGAATHVVLYRAQVMVPTKKARSIERPFEPRAFGRCDHVARQRFSIYSAILSATSTPQASSVDEKPGAELTSQSRAPVDEKSRSTPAIDAPIRSAHFSLISTISAVSSNFEPSPAPEDVFVRNSPSLALRSIAAMTRPPTMTTRRSCTP